MTSDLQRSKREIEDYNKNLEQRVHEATGRLQQAYQELQSAQTQLVANEKMATLGVLVAGVAHEINTPTGAILNVSRNLERQIEALPDHLATFKRDPDSPVDAMVDCLRALIASSRRSQPSASLKVQKAVEATLREHGVPDVSVRAASLCKLNFTDPQEITRYIECFRVASFFAFAETFASIAQAAHISETSARKIAEIIRALKYYAYADTERVEMVQVNDSIATALVLLDNHLKHKVAVRADYDPELPRIPCTSELHQVWTNLLTNASDAIGERQGGSPGEIRIATRRDGEAVVVSISDNGPGIPAEARERIFDPFFTTKDVGKGTGLGLCIVSGIVKKHHGTIRLDSVPGRTTFEVVVPLTGHNGNGSLPASDVAVPATAPGDERQAA
jgi:C4-dicarboxylate-specific signal transduction histidine kinase